MKGSYRKEQLDVLRETLQKIKDADNNGPILEFGVYEGYSLSEMLLFLNKNNMTNKVHGFDGFEGQPKSEHIWIKGEAASTLENTFELIEKKVENVDNLSLHKGIFEKTIKKDIREIVNTQQAALIHIDCDLSGSCRHVLEVCKPIIHSGTFVVFHDWVYLENVWDKFAAQHNIEASGSVTILQNKGNQVVLEIGKKP